MSTEEDLHKFPNIPDVSENYAKELMKEYYGFHVSEMKEFVSYSDRNLFFKVSNIGPDIYPDGYVLKILNSEDSKDLKKIDGVSELMFHINDHVTSTTIPVKNKEGKYWFLLELPCLKRNDFKDKFVVRVLKFVPGILLATVEYDKKLSFHCGAMTAKLTNCLQKFSCEGIEKSDVMWSMKNTPIIRICIDSVEDTERRKIYHEVIDCLEKEVLKCDEKLTKTIVHGDLNEQNILLKIIEGTKDYEWCGVIDYGDVNYAYKIFEIALMIGYLMCDCKTMDPIEAGGHCLAGFLKNGDLSKAEYDVLITCIKSRLVQSLAMGYYSYLLYPENKYLLVTSETAWNILKLINESGDEAIMSRWNQIVESYGVKIPS